MTGQRPMTGPIGDDLSLAVVEEALVTRYMGQDFIYLDSAPSTQDRARQEALAGASEGTMVLAEEQTEGRGRFGRAWVSPRGSALLLSIILRPAIEILPQLNMVASLAVVRAVAAETGLKTQIKWPNDVQIGGKKLAGMLIDTEVTSDGVNFAVIGIGLNVALDPSEHPEIADIATSLSHEMGRRVRRLGLLRELLTATEDLYETVKSGASLLDEWRTAMATLGQDIRVRWPGDEGETVEEGRAEDVDEEGALLLRRADGTIARVVAGEVSLSG